MAKVVLITGASTGIGRETAKLLTARGYRVFGTSRKPTSDTLDGFDLLPLDVTDDESARACVQMVIERAGRLDVLVNNAGVDLMGAIEETSLDEVRWVMETNFFGVVRMVQLVLPQMRAQDSGHIINVSSGLGRVALPFEAFYCASKHALEAYTEALYHEMALFGISVHCIEPGYFRTNIGNATRYPETPLPVYDETRKKALKVLDWMLEQGGDPIDVAQKVLRLIEGQSTMLRQPVGADAALVTRLSLLPLLIVPVRKLARWYFGVDDFKHDLRRFAGRAVPVVIVGSVLAFVRRRAKK